MTGRGVGVGKSAQARTVAMERKRISEAALVLDWAPDKAQEVITGVGQRRDHGRRLTPNRLTAGIGGHMRHVIMVAF
jgi:hypothetical protein